jgi:hypothetical protein
MAVLNSYSKGPQCCEMASEVASVGGEKGECATRASKRATRVNRLTFISYYDSESCDRWQSVHAQQQAILI